MSCKWPNEHAYQRVRVSSLLNCVLMLDGYTPPIVDIDDLAMEATDLLDQFRKRGMEDSVQRKLVGKALDLESVEKLKGLIAKFETAIQAHNAEVAAAHAALEAQEFAALDHMDASFSSFPSFSTEMPSSGATKGNTEETEGNTDANSQLGAVDVTSRCTIRISRPHRKELRHHQDKHNATVLAAARA
jgi:hypothetical protein